MIKKSQNRGRLILLSFFVLFAATALLVGTATAVTHTEVESVTRYAPSGPAPDAEIEVKLTISGEPPLVVGIVETIPEGFTFPSSAVSTIPHKISGQKISFAVIDETVVKYKVIAPSSGDGTFTGEWVDLLVLSPELEEGKEGRWHTVAPGEGTTVIIGGGGSSAIEEEEQVTPTPTPFVPAVTKATKSIPAMEAGKEVAMVFEDMDVALIALKADINVSDVEVKVERVERTLDIPEPSGIAYTYLDIGVEHVAGAKIEGRLEFKVAKSWIADNSIDGPTVTLNRYDETGGEWKVLPTYKTGEDSATVYFEAEAPGFSMFAVTGEKNEAEVEAAAMSVSTSTSASATATPGPTTMISATPATSEELPGFEAILAVVSLVVAYLVVFGKKGKGEVM